MPLPLPPTRRAGPDACPGVRSVWTAADGGLARVRLPGGRLTPEQLGVLADAAAELGNGGLELTVRGNVQVRGLAAGAEHALAARLRPAGLLRSDTHDRVRNILASPLHGLGPRPDVADVIEALDDALCADAALVALPGRFLFCVDDGTGDVVGADADVTLFAGAGWTVLLSGVAVGVVEDGRAAVGVAIAAAHAFLAERGAQCSPAWRLAELTDGPRRVADRLPRRPAPGRPAFLRPASGVRSGTPNPGCEVPDGTLDGEGRRVGPGPWARADGGTALVVGVPEGRLDVSMARRLRAAARPGDVLRVTPWRSVVLPTAPERTDALRAGGFVVGT